MEDTTISTEERTGIYADIQNLQEISRNVLLALIRNWPERMPQPSRLNLYVRADHTHLWRVWATDAFDHVEVTVKGVQHYSLAATKNAADMAIAVDAISDFNHKRITHVAVISDDSDFISLYAKLAEEVSVNYPPHQTGHRVPFLWVLTDRRDTKSNLLQDFFPKRYIHVVDRFAPIPDRPLPAKPAPGVSPPPSPPSAATKAVEPEPEPEPPSAPAEEPHPPIREQRRELKEAERIALQLIRDLPVGGFKSTDCQDSIRSNFPGHPLAAADGPTLGTIFRRDVFPHMEERGVREIGNRKPRLYEMTHEAKRSLARF